MLRSEIILEIMEKYTWKHFILLFEISHDGSLEKKVGFNSSVKSDLQDLLLESS